MDSEVEKFFPNEIIKSENLIALLKTISSKFPFWSLLILAHSKNFCVVPNCTPKILPSSHKRLERDENAAARHQAHPERESGSDPQRTDRNRPERESGMLSDRRERRAPSHEMSIATEPIPRRDSRRDSRPYRTAHRRRDAPVRERERSVPSVRAHPSVPTRTETRSRSRNPVRSPTDCTSAEISTLFLI